MFFLFTVYVNIGPLSNFSQVGQTQVTDFCFLSEMKSWICRKSWLHIQENAVTFVLFNKTGVKVSNTFGGGDFQVLYMIVVTKAVP